MKFIDAFVFREDRFSVGVEQETGKHYLAIPVSNGLIEYEEYYEIGKEMFDRLPNNIVELRAFAQECRLRHEDDRLIVKPGTKRGSAI
jgi:predicted transcriptional regulator